MAAPRPNTPYSSTGMLARTTPRGVVHSLCRSPVERTRASAYTRPTGGLMPQRFIAAVDVGASNVRVAIANPDGEIEARRAFPYPGGAPDEALAKVGRAIDELARGVWVGAKVAAIGVVLPGAVDPAAGVVSTPANLPGWGDVAIGDLLGKPRGVPVAVENDANAAALGERWLGAARGLDDFVFIALGTGIGAGVVLGGRLRRGAHFLAGEVAYFPMTRENLRQAD